MGRIRAAWAAGGSGGGGNGGDGSASSAWRRREPQRARRRGQGLGASIRMTALLLGVMVLLRVSTVAGFELSCASARVPAPSTLDFCAPIVTWRAAAVYAHINYTDFRAGARFTDLDQDRIAKRQYEDLVYGREGEVSEPCAHALRRFVCASVFPECPQEGVGVPHRAACRPVCREAEALCGLPLACEFFQSQDCTPSSSGVMGVEDGFFLLKDDQGPYEPLPYLYGGLLGVWMLLSLVWVYNIWRPIPSPNNQQQQQPQPPVSRLCRLLTCVPLAKVAMMLLSLCFWATCVQKGYCSFWMGVGLINAQLLYETFSLVGFVLIAKGWCITRPGFHPGEWRAVIILMCAFYLASSSLLLIRRVVLSSAVFWLCTGLLYGSAYGYVLANVRDRTHGIRRQIRRLLRAEGGRVTGQTAPDARFRLDLLGLKLWMYQTLSVLLTVFCATELLFCLLPVVHHVDLPTFLPAGIKGFLDALAELDARLWLTLIVHEIVEITVLFMVGFLFRPRLLTAFDRTGLWTDDLHLRGPNGEGTGMGRSKRPQPPPLYLIPVPSEAYYNSHQSPSKPGPPKAAGGGGGNNDDDSTSASLSSSSASASASSSSSTKKDSNSGLLIPRKELSPSDLQFTLSSSGPRPSRRRRQRRREQQEEAQAAVATAAPSASASGAGVVEGEAAAAAAVVARAATVALAAVGAAAEEEAERLRRLSSSSAASSSSSGASVAGVVVAAAVGAGEGQEEEEEEKVEEEEVLGKPVLAYHASRFLVVQLPNGLYAVAVAEEEGDAGAGALGTGEGEKAVL